jgi:hypothetical protein
MRELALPLPAKHRYPSDLNQYKDGPEAEHYRSCFPIRYLSRSSDCRKANGKQDQNPNREDID